MLTTEHLQAEYGEALRAFIRGRAKTAADGDDILQDVFVKVHEALRAERVIRNPEQWVFRIARNALTDHYRAAGRALYESESEPERYEVSDTSDYENRFCCLHPFINDLPPKYKRPFVMSELRGIRQKDIAQRLSLSLSGAKSRVQRAREMLKKRFVECCNYKIDASGRLYGEQDCRRCESVSGSGGDCVSCA